MKRKVVVREKKKKKKGGGLKRCQIGIQNGCGLVFITFLGKVNCWKLVRFTAQRALVFLARF